MELLVYNELEPARLKPQYERVCEMLREERFQQAEVKKLTPGPYFRAKLSDADRLLFSFVTYKGTKYILLLEIIYNHAYEKSRFLNGAVIDESKMKPLNRAEELQTQDVAPLVYRNPGVNFVHLLDRPLSFDEAQEHLYHGRLPLIIVGSAGSGKTVLSLEKLKTLPGDVLYVTRSSFLAENARRLYSSYGYDNSKQNIDFYSFEDLLRSIYAPQGQLVTFDDFGRWLRNQSHVSGYDSHQLYEEFFGVLTGHCVDRPYLSEEEYVGLGIKQSIFPVEARSEVYGLFRSWQTYMERNELYADNQACFDALALAEPRYDYMVVDEVQDLTNVQLCLALKTLKSQGNFLLCGDSNQIVHPNFFNWSSVKSLFYTGKLSAASAEIQILHANYRNSAAVTGIANQLLRVKVARFGSVDRESNYLVSCTSELPGEVNLLPESRELCRELNEKTSKSVNYAVLVLQESDKEMARRIFNTPLVFTVREAKGLEYQHVIMYNILSSSKKAFDVIAEGVDRSELQGELKYNRNKDKSDKSLEIYKFFINSLYVAVTRAVCNLYWIEREGNHPMMRLMNLQLRQNALKLEQAASSADEWRKEAIKLAAQGRKEQSARILTDVLKLEPVPWQVITRDKVMELLEQAINRDKVNSRARNTMMLYAHAYRLNLYNRALQYNGFQAASNRSEIPKIYARTCIVPYNIANRKQLVQKIDRYGIDFRDEYNRTPLMRACETGDAALAAELLKKSANPELVDNQGFSAYHYMLRTILEKKSLGNFVDVYSLLEPPSITVRLNKQEMKIGRQKAEFMFLQLFLVGMRGWNIHEDPRHPAFHADFFQQVFSLFPHRLVPEYRHKQTYCSSILSKNEIESKNPYSMKLFGRMKLGNYLLNPWLELCYDGKWYYWDQLLQLEHWEVPYTNDFCTAMLMYNHIVRNKLWQIMPRYWEDTYTNYLNSDMKTGYTDFDKETFKYFKEIVGRFPGLPADAETLKKYSCRHANDEGNFIFQNEDVAQFWKRTRCQESFGKYYDEGEDEYGNKIRRIKKVDVYGHPYVNSRELQKE